jgi:hypothetical protein
MKANKVDSLEKRLMDNSTTLIMQTKPFPIKENLIYYYTVTTEAKNGTAYSGNIPYSIII